MPVGATKKLEDVSQFTFAKFASQFFTHNASYWHTKRQLLNSLTLLPILSDQISAQAIWITILRFMGDMAEAKYEDEEENRKVTVMNRVSCTLSKSFARSKEFQELLTGNVEYEGREHKKLINRTLKNKTKIVAQVKNTMENQEEIESYQKWLGVRSTNLEKLHFIISHGILRKLLRDEIYCQICKQITNNPNHISAVKGWILLALCVGCFPPSENLELYLRSFIRDGPELYSPFIEERLNRILLNGTRKQPPSYLELNATKTKQAIMVDVNLMDGSTHRVTIDSSSTAAELVQQLSQIIKLKDTFGFAIFTTVYDKIMSLGSQGDFVMDAISSCEQYTKEQGGNERKSPWKLLFRKEIFAPWHNPADDSIATDLIYRQVVRGVNTGEYVCKTDKDVSMIAALQYFVEYGTEMKESVLRKMLPLLLPKDLLLDGDKALDKWTKEVSNAFHRSKTVQNKLPIHTAKEDIVVFSQVNWAIMFSRFYEAKRINSGAPLPVDDVVIGINWSGVYLFDFQEQVLLEMSYPEIVSVVYEASDEIMTADNLIVNTIQKDTYIFECREAKSVVQLVEYLLKGLKIRSSYAVAVQDYCHKDKLDTYLTLTKGDLIKLGTGFSGGALLLNDNTWAFGECKGISGEFPTAVVYLLPSIFPPPVTVLALFEHGAVKPNKHASPAYNTVQRSKMHTLKKYADENFRNNTDAGPRASTVLTTIRLQAAELWQHTSEPIKAPLTYKLQTIEKSFGIAVATFTHIMKYMGDLPRHRSHINTDHIFGAALKDELLKDEVYCQIMRQLTDNKILVSEERGWDLMWLATGVMIPSPPLLKELIEFLRSRKHPVADQSFQRLQKTIRGGERKYPPYIIEVEAIRNRTVQIFHKIYFPDDTNEAFEIESSTRARDLSKLICRKLQIKYADGLSLFVRIMDKAFSVPEDYFIFDFIYELVEWMKSTLTNREPNQEVHCQYQLFFMRKLWINYVPGRDKNADLIFHFPQEMPKLLNGYYKISKNEAVRFAAYLYRAQYGKNSGPLQQKLQEILPRIVPEDLLPIQKPDAWRQSILAVYNSQIELDENEAKEAFLNAIKGLQNFGSTFFVVKQTTDNNLPSTILIAINRNGFHIVDPLTKSILITYEFGQMSFWSSGKDFFNIRFGNMMGASKLYCETSQGYKMDDLLSSYIQYVQTM